MTRLIEFHSKVWTLFVWNFWLWHDTSFWLKVNSSPILSSRFCAIRPGIRILGTLRNRGLWQKEGNFPEGLLWGWKLKKEKEGHLRPPDKNGHLRHSTKAATCGHPTQAATRGHSGKAATRGHWVGAFYKFQPLHVLWGKAATRGHKRALATIHVGKQRDCS